MNSNGYIFDKRKRKRKFIKILILFFIGFVPIVVFNILFAKYIKKDWLIILFDCILMVTLVLPFNKLLDKHYAKKDEQLEKKVKARKEMEERKKQILEDSYKKKRQEKEKAKKEKTKES